MLSARSSSSSFRHSLQGLGVHILHQLGALEARSRREELRPETRLIFSEILGNPGLDILDITVVSDVAHQAGIPLLVDSTFTTPYLCKPLDFGADLIFHSATKFLGGHGVAIGGVVVDGGRFDWEASGKFPTLTETYEGFHGMDFDEE